MCPKLIALTLAVLVVGCRPQPDGPVIVTQTVILPGGPSGQPTPSPTPTPGAVASVNLGCFGMQDPAGNSLPPCGANLATYTAPPGTTGILDATPLDGDGNKVEGQTVEGWFANGPCTLSGITTGSDGFNPGIFMAEGSCVVTVRIAGVVGGPRLFVGEP